MSTSYSNLDTKMRNLVNSYRSVSTLHPVVSELCQSLEFEQNFWISLNQDLHVICQRSQILAHGEITAMQKAFVTLMARKEDLIPAIQLYVDEILGLKFVSESGRASILNTMIQTRHSILGQAYGSKPNQSPTVGNRALPSFSHLELSRHKPLSEALFVLNSSEKSRTSDLPLIAGEVDQKFLTVDTPGDLASISNDGDQKLERLFIVYHIARKDFDATPAKTLERTQSAKFLRDTTENCLAYIAAKQTRPEGSKAEVTYNGKMLDELRATLEETTAIAERGSGGKKRRFDENWESVPQEPARMRRPSATQPSGKSDPVPRGRNLKKERLIIPRIQELQVTPKFKYRHQNMNLAERRRSDQPHQPYPASAGQSARRVFGHRHKLRAERTTFSGHVYGDRYRPTYN